MKYLIMVFTIILLFGLAVFAEETINDEKEAVDSVIVNDSTVSETEEIIKNKVIAYYFHGNRRCKSCLAIEEYSQVAIDSGFKDELKSGTLEFLTINRDEKENKHYTKNYELYTSSLVISKIENNKEIKWKNLEKVWQLKGNKIEFIQYVQDEINKFMKTQIKTE
jgi:hypothetical protein